MIPTLSSNFIGSNLQIWYRHRVIDVFLSSASPMIKARISQDKCVAFPVRIRQGVAVNHFTSKVLKRDAANARSCTLKIREKSGLILSRAT